jgi:hypothetical protein
MSELVAISVYRELGDRLQPGGSQSDNSPKSWDLHRLRAAALHEALGDDPAGWRVIDWGCTDDERRTHELVEVLVGLVGGGTLTAIGTPVLNWVGEVLSGVLTDSATDAIKVIISRLRRKQEEHKIRDFCISMDGRELMRIDPDALGGAGSVQLQMPDGRFVNVAWSATATELQ